MSVLCGIFGGGSGSGGGVSDHNDLTGIQGGDTDEYYHLTESERDQIAAAIAAIAGGGFLTLDQTSAQTIANGQPIQATLTASEIVATDADKKLQSLAVATYPSLTELSYVKGLTSSAQTQITAKAISPATNTADYIPQWDGVDSKTLKNGIDPSTLALVSSVPVKATGAELDTGTDDAKIATAKALKDSHNIPSIAPGTLGRILKSDGTDWVAAARVGGVVLRASVSSGAIATGAKKIYIQTNFAGTIVGWRLISDVSTIATVDIWKAAGAIPTVSDTITASAKPALSSATVASSTTLTGWTTAVAIGDIFELNVDSNSASAVLNLQLDIEVS